MPKHQQQELLDPLAGSRAGSDASSADEERVGHSPPSQFRGGDGPMGGWELESDGSKKEGFEIAVFLPQLMLRLFPPLMLLQLVPDFHPRVDHLVFASGVALIVLGRFTWQSYHLGAGVFIFLMSLPGVIKTARPLVCPRCATRTKPRAYVQAIIWCIVGIALMSWGIGHRDALKRSVEGVDLKRDPYDSATLFTGLVLVLVVVLVRLFWFIDALADSWNEVPDVSVWSKPYFTTCGIDLDLTWMFVERFSLGEMYLARPWDGPSSEENTGGMLKLRDDIKNEGWKDQAILELNTKLYKGGRLERLRRLSEENDEGNLLPIKVLTLVPHQDDRKSCKWTVKWERYERIKHKSLCLRIDCPQEQPLCLELSLDASCTRSEWIGHGGDYATGYRVTIDPVPPPDARGGNPAGDYLHDGNVASVNRSLTGGGPKPLEFTERVSKRKLLYDKDEQKKWIIARPSMRATRMSSEFYSPDKYKEHDFEAEQDSRDWTQSGPPTTIGAPWVPRAEPAEVGQSRTSSPDLRMGRSPPLSVPRTKIQVDGFVTAEYEVSFPRRIGVSFKTMLGATVHRNNNVEFLILQIENFFYSMIQFTTIYFVLHVYAINKQVVQQQSGGLMDHDLWTSNNTFLTDWIVHWIEEDLLRPSTVKDEHARAMRLASSEVLLPTAMYLFVCIVSALEHAMWSGVDTLAESREDRWYRRALIDSTQGSYSDVRSRSSQNRGTVALTAALLVIALACIVVDPLLDERVLWKLGVFLLFCVLFCAGSVGGVWRRLADWWYRAALYIFLFTRRPSCNREKLRKDFKNELEETDRSLRASYAMDKRDEMRKHELMLTYIESPMWQPFRTHGPDGWRRHFRGISDAVVDSDLGKLRQDMIVFPMLPSDNALARQTSSAGEQDRYRRGVPIFESDGGTTPCEMQNSAETCVSAGHVAEMIIGLSKARRLVHTRRNMLVVLVISAVHAIVPAWHAWLPKMFGGGCGVGEGKELWMSGTVLGINYDVGKLVACSESWHQVAFHVVCAVLNLTLSYSILYRLLKCRADYFARYCHMLYFIQLTPWSNLRTEKMKEHWGFLPTFNLDTPGNVEAWNKLRLYLQSWQIKTSRTKQVAALCCFIGVVGSGLLKIVEMAVVQTRREPDLTNACDLRWGDNETAAEQECIAHLGCKWVNRDGVNARCLPNNDGSVCQQHDDQAVSTVKTCLLHNGNDPSHPICDWDIGRMECDEVEQHFDTMSMFVVVETLIIGVGLLVTLWEGMLSNEIKREAFPHVIRMKHSELLSSSMHFVTERSHWEKNKRYWRAAEVKLVSLVNKLRMISAVRPSKLAEEIGTQRQREELGQKLLRRTMGKTMSDPALKAERAKSDAEAYIRSAGFYAFVDGRHSPPDGMLDLLVQELKRAHVFGAEEARLVSNAQDKMSQVEAELNEQRLAESRNPAESQSLLSKACRELVEAQNQQKRADIEARKYAADLMSQGCTNAHTLLQLVLINQIGSSRESAGADSIEQQQAYQLLSQAAYPFGSLDNRQFPPGRPKADLAPLLRQRRHGPTEGSAQARIQDAMHPEPEPEPEPELEPELFGATNAIQGFGTGLLGDTIPVEFSKHAADERERCIRMLKLLADMLDDEYSEGGRAHWGSEDRRTKMWFINLNRPLMLRIIVVIVGQFVAATGAGVIKFLYSAD